MKNIVISSFLVFFVLLGLSQEGVNEKNLFINTELVFSTGVGNVRIDNTILDANYERSYAAKLIVGKEFLPRLSVGGMVMYDYYSEAGFLMIGPDIRYSLAESGDFGVFVSATGGYGFVTGNTERSGGLFLYPSLGTTIDLNQAYSLLLSLGYKRQHFQDTTTFETLEEGEAVVIENENAYSTGFLSFSVGLQF